MAHTIRDKKKLLNRVRRIRGQIAAVEKALDQELHLRPPLPHPGEAPAERRDPLLWKPAELRCWTLPDGPAVSFLSPSFSVGRRVSPNGFNCGKCGRCRWRWHTSSRQLRRTSAANLVDDRTQAGHAQGPTL
jgi:hypothetical protein